MKVLCGYHRNWLAGPCGATATMVLRMACVHEHFGEDTVCDEHRVRVDESIAEVDWICIPCRDGAEPHDCPITIVSRRATIER